MTDYNQKTERLVQQLADEIEKRGKVAYYTTLAANLASVRVALRCGFVPFMIEYYAEPLD